MNVLDRIMTRNRQQKYLEQRIVWGIWAPRGLQVTYKVLAARLRVPISVLVCHILREWLANNYASLHDDPDARTRLGDLLAKENSGDEEEK